MVLGGPGTGKTLVVTEAAAARVLAGSSLERVIVLAHSRTAAQQLRRDIMRRLPRAQTSAQVTTVHGLSLGLLSRYRPHEDSPWRLLRAPSRSPGSVSCSRVSPWMPGPRRCGWPSVPARSHGSCVRCWHARASSRWTPRASPPWPVTPGIHCSPRWPRSWRATSPSATSPAPSTTPSWCTGPGSC
ncbi:AAA family ATPase [Tessaracoccus sp. HDW20]|nr:AAA family ATPase [Tessaracoccus coleopterorum]